MYKRYIKTLIFTIFLLPLMACGHEEIFVNETFARDGESESGADHGKEYSEREDALLERKEKEEALKKQETKAAEQKANAEAEKKDEPPRPIQRADRVYLAFSAAQAMTADMDTNMLMGVSINRAPAYENLMAGSVKLGRHNVAATRRYELQFALSDSTVDFSSNNSSGSADVLAASLMGNMYFDWYIRDYFVPFFGMGIGITALSYTDFDVRIENGDNAPIAIWGDADILRLPSAQIMFGAVYDITQNAGFGIDLTYLMTTTEQLTLSGLNHTATSNGLATADLLDEDTVFIDDISYTQTSIGVYFLYRF